MPRLPLIAALAAALVLPAPASAIVGGTPPTRDYPFMSALELDDSQYCGASLVAPQWILTAAHCMWDFDGKKVTPDRLTFQIGGVPQVDAPANLYTQTDDGERIGATEVRVHPSWQSPAPSSHDVALVKLARPSTYAPIALADPATQRALWNPGAEATVIGYGAQFWQTPGLTGLLMEAKVPIVDDEECDLEYGPDFDVRTMVCAGNIYGTEDSCQGDSGGPLVVENGAGLLQVGVVSWGFGCGLPVFAGVYSRVGDTTLNQWIHTQIDPPATTTTNRTGKLKRVR